MSAPIERISTESAIGYIGRIPVRNLWLLMLYASDLYRQVRGRSSAVEDNPDDLPDLVAEILAHHVERRLKRNLTYGYRTQRAVLGRVRGRIDHLSTKRHQLMERGLVACRFENLTIDTPRNRYVRGALESIARIVRTATLRRRCKDLAASLKLMGVLGETPSRQEMSTDRCGRHDSNDQHMISAARLALDLALPTENPGDFALGAPAREAKWIWDLYERAVGGFYAVVLTPEGWNVDQGRYQNWQIEHKTDGIDKVLPSMQTDIILEHPLNRHRIVIDTKFTSIFTPSQYREESLRSGHLYQMYAYIRSQVGDGTPFSEHASGLLLHPSIGVMIDEVVVIQGHAIRFATVDLSASAVMIREQLLRVVRFPARGQAIEGSYTQANI